ncbi:MAG: hypothetical protein WCD18_14650, partial [Thermosynechococcaceae cyanobacterium]
MMTSAETLGLPNQSQPGATQPVPASSDNRTVFQRIQSALQAHLVGTITVSLLFGLALTGTSAWNIWRIYQGLQNTVAKQFLLQDLSGEIIHLDEVLTMSARMAASTGNTKWEDRYNTYVPQLDSAISTVLKEVPASEQSNPEQTDIANKKLVDMETQSFALVRQGKSGAALQLLLGTQYETQKKIYSAGINETLNTVKKNVAAQLQDYRTSLLWAVVFAATSVLLLAASWFIVLLAVRGYILDRKAAKLSLLTSQESLMTLN